MTVTDPTPPVPEAGAGAADGPGRGAGRSERRLRTPAVILVLGGIGALFLGLPLLGLLVEAPWSDLGSVLGSEIVLEALRVSLVTSMCAAALSIAFGVPLAWLLARVEFRGRALLRGVVTLPIVLPPVVGGVALLATLGRRGWLGGILEQQLGVVLPFSMAGTVLAQTFVAMPFLVVTVEAALQGVDRRAEDAAEVLGAGPWRTFADVTLPAAGPAIVAGTALAWARALGEFGATITFAGSLQGRTQTLPLAVYLALETDPGVAIVMSLVLVAVSLTVLVALRSRWLPEVVRRPGR